MFKLVFSFLWFYNMFQSSNPLCTHIYIYIMLIILYHIILYYIISHYIISYYIISYHIIFYYMILYYINFFIYPCLQGSLSLSDVWIGMIGPQELDLFDIFFHLHRLPLRKSAMKLRMTEVRSSQTRSILTRSDQSCCKDAVNFFKKRGCGVLFPGHLIQRKALATKRSSTWPCFLLSQSSKI